MFVLGQTQAAQPAKPGPLIGYELVDTSGVFPLLHFEVLFFSALLRGNFSVWTLCESLNFFGQNIETLQDILVYYFRPILDLFKMSGQPAPQCLWNVCPCIQAHHAFAQSISRASQY